MMKNAIQSWNQNVSEPTLNDAARAHRRQSRQAQAQRAITVREGGVETSVPVDGHLDRDGWTRLLTFLEATEPSAAGGAYETVRRKLVKFFRAKGVVNCEDLADATFDRVARKLGDERVVDIRNPTGYVLGVARLIWLESVKREVSCRNRLDQHEATRDPEARGTELERDLAILERCMVELRPEERQLLLGYYDGQGRARIETREALVRRFGLNPGLLRTRVHRLRAQLEVRVKAMLTATEAQSA